MADNPQKPDEEKNKTAPIKIKSGDKKSETTRIDLASAKPPPSIIDKNKLPADADDYFKRSTMRIDTAGSGPAKDETTRLDAGEAKGKTSRIEDAAAQTDDVFKQSTIPVGIPTSPPPSTGPAKPKTIQFKRPSAAKPSTGESIIVSDDKTADATAEARKSETARIDLEAEDENRPATRPKTIRIKRPDGTSGRKALAITRPEGESGPETAAAVAGAISVDAEDGPGTLAGVVAIAALLVICVVVYVLLAQTMLPNLPFPGRILL